MNCHPNHTHACVGVHIPTNKWMVDDTRKNPPEPLPTEILAVPLEEEPSVPFEPREPAVEGEKLAAACLARREAKYASLYWATHVNPHEAISFVELVLPGNHWKTKVEESG